MERHPLYGKRKKTKPVCPNPLFAYWLQEWKDDATEKGIKTQFVYAKALKSLRNYPLPIASGKDCKMLEYFGDKICKMLDVKLSKHIAEYGSADNAPFLMTEDEAPKQKKTQKKQIAKTEQDHRFFSAESENDDEEQAPVPRKRQKSGNQGGGGGREYIPAYRSGPYALLLTLYKHSQSDADRPYMSKADLIRQAQPLADKSFSIPDPSCRYTAWSSMGSLINKGLVVKESNPAKYSLTEAGCGIGHRLEAVKDGAAAPPGNTNTIRTGTNDIPATHVPQTVTSSANDININFKYIRDDNTEVITKDQAAVSIDDDIGFGFLIKCNYQRLLSSGLLYKLDTSRPMTDHVYAYIKDSDAPDVAPGVPPLPTLNITPNIEVHHPIPIIPDHIPVQEAKKSVQEKKPRQKKQQSSMSNPSAGLKLLPLLDNLPPIPSFSKIQETIELDSQSSQSSIKSISSVSSTYSLPRPDFILRPGQFEIVLCIDNREFYGGGKKGSKNLLPDLMKNGINCDLRELQVGDLLWLAREKPEYSRNFAPDHKPKELVLDYIVERKRMDDLVHSCTDGRLKDQKFRLKHCGLRCPVFLVEDHGSMQHFSIPESTIKQTMTNLTVIDGFQLKRTKGSKETVAYLTIMTRHLQRLYRNKTLHACSIDEIQEYNKIFDINDSEQKLITFEHFNVGSVKSKILTVQEMFGKQLIQLYGMSAEKAKAISDKYNTLKELLYSYNECRTEKDKELMLSGIKCGKAMRNLGASQSRQIYQLYCTTGPLT
ncbi:crossover junction endonuclease MUS81-like isoform X1 [Mytilus californianus]|uniref:crossover junction endonuclease MUS81-like isoform X1 n=1 Tax=Mytilus californianus TaxID=6549 RepID=UPI00224536AA|nr:crossover junction endonuclease MUS81-like isoform X1 [Mytilus californianus]